MLLIFERLEETGKGMNRKINDPISPRVGSNSEKQRKVSECQDSSKRSRGCFPLTQLFTDTLESQMTLQGPCFRNICIHSMI